MESIQHSMTGAALHAQADGTRGSQLGVLLGVASVLQPASSVFARGQIDADASHGWVQSIE